MHLLSVVRWHKCEDLSDLLDHLNRDATNPPAVMMRHLCCLPCGICSTRLGQDISVCV
jgi:hypothetical protein